MVQRPFPTKKHFKVSRYTVDEFAAKLSKSSLSAPPTGIPRTSSRKEFHHIRAALDKVLAVPETHEFEKAQGPITKAHVAHLPVARTINIVGKDATCCAPHPEPSCADEGIRKCVCKHDPKCCTHEWDLQCADEVETFLCGQCPRPAFLEVGNQ